jgi:hypothetical protein
LKMARNNILKVLLKGTYFDLQAQMIPVIICNWHLPLRKNFGPS